VTKNSVVRLAQRPTGPARPEDFDIRQEDLPEPGDGEFRVKSAYISLDPAMRGWMNEAKSYVPPVGIGDVMRGFAAGHVEASRHPGFKEGDAITGLFGVQEYGISDGQGVSVADTSLAPLQTWVGGLGMPGLTAYFGLLEVAGAREGDTVVVSAASGAVGQVVGQIGNIIGCRTVGIAGGQEKCAFLTNELGFDAAVDYKAGNLCDDLATACPDGIDVNFENVGGEIFDTVLGQMNPFGRVAVCGLISMYNATEVPPGPKNIRAVLVMRLSIRGFIVFDFIEQYGEALRALGSWYKEGKLKFREDVREGGVAAYPAVLAELYTGGNFGKLILKV
jgi:hypothetical protein